MSPSSPLPSSHHASTIVDLPRRMPRACRIANGRTHLGDTFRDLCGVVPSEAFVTYGCFLAASASISTSSPAFRHERVKGASKRSRRTGRRCDAQRIADGALAAEPRPCTEVVAATELDDVTDDQEVTGDPSCSMT